MKLFRNKAVRSLTVSVFALALMILSAVAQMPNPSVPGSRGGFDPYQNFYPPFGQQYFLTSSWSTVSTCFQASPPAVAVSIASPAVVTISNQCAAGQAIQFQTSGALPTGLTAGTTYYVIAAGLSGSSFEISATSGGSAINTSGTQSGVQTAYAVYQNATTSFTPGIVLPPLPPGFTAYGHCTIFWQTTNTSGTPTLGMLLNNTTSTLYVLNTAHTGANGATLADVETVITNAGTTDTAISGTMTAGAANTTYRDDINFSLGAAVGTSATILSVEGKSSSTSYTASFQPGSYCTWGS